MPYRQPSTAANPSPGVALSRPRSGLSSQPEHHAQIGRPASADGGGAISPRHCAAACAPTSSHFLTSFPFPYYNRLVAARHSPISRRFSTTVPPVRQANRANRRTPFAAAVNAADSCCDGRFSSGPSQPDPHAAARVESWLLSGRHGWLAAAIVTRPAIGLAYPIGTGFLAGAPAGRRQQRSTEHHARPEDRDRVMEQSTMSVTC